MIQWIEGQECGTTGCSCCSIYLNVESDRERILNEARENIAVAKKVCKTYKIPFEKFCRSKTKKKED